MLFQGLLKHVSKKKTKNSENKNVIFQQICFSGADKYSRGVEHKGGEGALLTRDTNVFGSSCLNAELPIYIYWLPIIMAIFFEEFHEDKM